MKDINISVGFRVTDSKDEYRYAGVWYKPWTWLKWEKVCEIKEVDLIEFSSVSNPVNPHCKINE